MPKHASSSPEPPKFTCFSRLPLELQLLVWEIAAIPGPRKLKFILVKGLQTAVKKIKVTVARRQRIPALLHTNSQARKAALSKYSLAFQNHSKIKPVYVNFVQDTFYAKENMVFWLLEDCAEVLSPFRASTPQQNENMHQQFHKFIFGGTTTTVNHEKIKIPSMKISVSQDRPQLSPNHRKPSWFYRFNHSNARGCPSQIVVELLDEEDVETIDEGAI